MCVCVYASVLLGSWLRLHNARNWVKILYYSLISVSLTASTALHSLFTHALGWMFDLFTFFSWFVCVNSSICSAWKFAVNFKSVFFSASVNCLRGASSWLTGASLSSLPPHSHAFVAALLWQRFCCSFVVVVCIKCQLRRAHALSLSRDSPFIIVKTYSS